MFPTKTVSKNSCYNVSNSQTATVQ